MKQELQYQQFGSADAPCIVFLHGEGLSAQMWQPQIESLKDYHCIAPTFSVDCMEDPPTKFCFESAADSVADLISSVSFEGQAHLVGFSFGAALIMELLARYPERCISATLISPPSKLLSSASSMLLDAYEQGITYRADNATVKRWAERSYFDIPSPHTPAQPVSGFCERFAAMLHALRQNTPADITEDCFAPCLCICGEDEPDQIFAEMRLICKSVPYSEAILMQGCTNNIPWAAQDELNRIIRDWITGKPLSVPNVSKMKIS